MDLKKFLIDNRQLVLENDFELLYQKCNEPEELTKLLLDADINPLKYVISIPAAFAYGLNIDTINIPKDIKEIGWKAFEKSQIENINLKHIVFIDAEAFANCRYLTDIKLDKIVNIRTDAFYNCLSLNKVFIGSNIRHIDTSAFRGCKVIIEYDGTKESWLKHCPDLELLAGVIEIQYLK